MRLEGKVAIVTGAGRGIGRGEALALAREGAAVVVNDFGGSADGTGSSAAPAQQVADEIVAAGGRAAAHVGDVAQFKTGEELVQLALDQFGRLDVLVNNAGILRDRMIHNMSEAEWDIVLDVHLKGTFNCTRAAAQVFRSQRSGVVVNTSSESGFGNMGQANYAAAKEGIIGFTRTIARDLGRYGCRANAIRPRAATRLTLSDEMKEAAEKRRKAGGAPPAELARIERWDPDQVAPLVVWLCTDAARNINGRDFIVAAGEISLVSLPEAERTLCTAGDWTLDLLDAEMPGTLARGLRNLFVPTEAPRS
jgi:NAD(P)-dependent dehydrogenase (short-subunit alcohol dehydrogenase family)